MTGKRVTAAPLAMQLHLTRKCNLECTHCSADEFRVKEKGTELTTKEWINTIRRLKEIQVFEISLSGGEIFCRRDIFDILSVVKQCNFPKIRLTTNGTLINESVAIRLKELNFNTIQVSIDGNEECHERIRGVGSYALVITGITHLVANGIIPEIRFTPLKNNYRGLPELVDRLHRLNIKKLVLNSLKVSGKCRHIYQEIMLDPFAETDELQAIIDDIRSTYQDFSIGDADTHFRDLPARLSAKGGDLRGAPPQKLKPCSAAHSSCNITAGGWVIPCSELVDFKGGNIKELDLLDIWRHSVMFGEIRELSSVSSAQAPYCKDCDYNVLCSAGCRANAYVVYNDLLAQDPLCPYVKSV